MPKLILAAMLALSSLSASAALLDCDELIEKISKRLESKGISDYQLSAVPVKEAHAGKEVGTCQGGSMKVMLVRGKPAEDAGKE